MPTSVMQIPGYYWDAEKNRYFKVQANHQAPATSTYTKDAIAREKAAKDKREAANERSNQEQRELVHRSESLRHPLLGSIGLRRELGQHALLKHRHNAQALAIGTGLKEHPWDLPNVATCQTILEFNWDESTRSFLIAARADNGLCSLVSATTGRLLNNRTRLDFRWNELLADIQSDVSSISITPSRIAAITLLGQEERAELRLLTLNDPASQCPNTPAEFDAQVIYRFALDQTAWTSSANDLLPSSSSATFAVGITGRVVLFTGTPGNWDSSKFMHVDSDPLALAWLTPTTAAAGLRNGTVQLWDVRSNGAANRLTHGGSVTGMRRVGAERLVVAGLEGSLALYDLRMAREVEPQQWRHRRKRQRKTARGRTLPAVDFAHDDAHPGALGFDVSPGLGLVAAADGENVVQLYSIATGAPVQGREEGTELRVNKRTDPRIRGLKFMEIDGGDGLVGSWGTHLVHWKW